VDKGAYLGGGYEAYDPYEPDAMEQQWLQTIRDAVNNNRGYYPDSGSSAEHDEVLAAIEQQQEIAQSQQQLEGEQEHLEHEQEEEDASAELGLGLQAAHGKLKHPLQHVELVAVSSTVAGQLLESSGRIVEEESVVRMDPGAAAALEGPGEDMEGEQLEGLYRATSGDGRERHLPADPFDMANGKACS
jgi:hypothetical protein